VIHVTEPRDPTERFHHEGFDLSTSSGTENLEFKGGEQSATTGGATRRAGTGVWLGDLWNLSAFRPAHLPIPEIWSAFLRVRMAIRRSLVARMAARLDFSLLTAPATRGGSNSTIMCRDIVLPLAPLLG
jgi:hypothetical protein